MDKYAFLLLLLGVIASVTYDLGSCTKPKPDQIRLAVASDTDVNVGWHLRSCPYTNENPNPNPTVIHGLSPKNFTKTSINGVSNSYMKNVTSGVSWFYSVELQKLQPSTIYYYQITVSTFVSASDILSFTSAPTIGDRSRPVKIAAYGDLGVDGFIGTYINGSCLFAQALKALQKKLPEIDFFLHHGGICYADDGLLLKPPRPYEATLDYCQTKMSVLTSVRFYMTALGNHEINCTEVPEAYNACPSYHRKGIPYRNRFNMPTEQSGGNLSTWYSFNYAFIHVISLSCETDFPNAPSGVILDNMTQVNWLRNDLAAVNRDITPWVIVQCHRPWKGSIAVEAKIEGGIINCPACQQAFENILIDYKVDIYIAGHVHWYERICLNGMYSHFSDSPSI